MSSLRSRDFRMRDPLGFVNWRRLTFHRARFSASQKCVCIKAIWYIMQTKQIKKNLSL